VFYVLPNLVGSLRVYRLYGIMGIQIVWGNIFHYGYVRSKNVRLRCRNRICHMFDTRGVLEYYCYVDVVSRIYHIAHVSLLCFVSYRPYVIYD